MSKWLIEHFDHSFVKFPQNHLWSPSSPSSMGWWMLLAWTPEAPVGDLDFRKPLESRHSASAGSLEFTCALVFVLLSSVYSPQNVRKTGHVWPRRNVFIYHISLFSNHGRDRDKSHGEGIYKYGECKLWVRSRLKLAWSRCFCLFENSWVVWWRSQSMVERATSIIRQLC